MTELLLLGIGSLGISLVTVYLMWVQFRVVVFRQQIFAIRDELWDQARKLDALDDMAHRKARRLLNGLIRFAPMLNVATLMVLFIRSSGSKSASEQVMLQTDNAALKTAIDRSLSAANVRSFDYILYYTLSGTVLRAVLFTLHLFKTATAFQSKVQRSTRQLVSVLEVAGSHHSVLDQAI